jgi:predicted PurR-regulated permease PerM
VLLGWGIFVVSMADNIIKSWFLSGAVRIPFLLGFFGVLGGLLAFGPIGLFVGPVAIALLLTLWREWTRAQIGPGDTC